MGINTKMKSCIMKLSILISIITVIYCTEKILHPDIIFYLWRYHVPHVIPWQDKTPNQQKTEKPDSPDNFNNQEAEEGTENDNGFHYDPNIEEGDEDLSQSEDDY